MRFYIVLIIAFISGLMSKELELWKSFMFGVSLATCYVLGKMDGRDGY